MGGGGWVVTPRRPGGGPGGISSSYRAKGGFVLGYRCMKQEVTGTGTLSCVDTSTLRCKNRESHLTREVLLSGLN